MGVSGAHVGGDGTRHFDLDQFPFADTGAPVARITPVAFVADEFGPEWKRGALEGLGFVYRAATIPEEFALGMTRNP